MSNQRQLNNRRDNFLTKINNILGMGNNSSVGRINYWDPTIPDPRFDPTKQGPQYEQLPDGTLIKDGVIISEDAPTGWLGIPRVFAGAYDALPWTTGDLDKRGSGLDQWKRRIDAPGTLGGVPIQIFAEKKNTDYDPTKAVTSDPVPNIGSGLSVGKIVQDAYSGWRDRRIADRGAERNLLYNQIANKYAYDLNKAGMLEAMNTPYWKAKTSLTAQQALAIPRLAKAALIEARAKSQDAANEFGQLGLKRTYFSP
tara:strand:- start:512 stop:1276 length:765 start_codon:yes stop_codon:yes gene_type:complete